MPVLAGVFIALAAVAPAGAAPSPPEQAAIFRGAGFSRRAGQWKSGNCNGAESASYSPGAIELMKDLNGDGRPEAIVTEGGAICYGDTGTAFWLVSKQPNGSWKPLLKGEIGMPELLSKKGVGGWPDISVGGPGFCFPVLRWNGRAYAHHRFEYEGKPCRG